MNKFVFQENKLRTNAYQKDESAERIFKEMNLFLEQLEQPELSGVDYPTLFIFGLPRSGTTLTYQLFAQCLDLGYVNNLIAHFWLSPQHGVTLSRAVLGSLSETSFHSDYGKTQGPSGPHEFAYFWQHWLKINDVEDMLIFNQPNLAIDWDRLGRTVRCVQDAFKKGVVFKTMYSANHIRAFAENFAMPLFIYVERDPIDVALSILSARKKYYGRSDVWWATHPPNYQDLAGLPFDEQIAGQVHSLKRTYEDAIELIPSELVIRLSYSKLCDSPPAALAQVKERYSKVYDFSLGTYLDPPNRFETRKRDKPISDEEHAIVEAMEIWK